jgi:hypothetical protein
MRRLLVGLVRIGEKRSHDVYRPDQIEQVTRGAPRGLGLYALRLEQAASKAVHMPRPTAMSS